MSIKNICIFCGSSTGNDDIYQKNARKLGVFLGQNQYTLVYGGGKIGLMGTVANACLDNGGSTIGVIPKFLEAREIAHQELTELIIVETMHQRKNKMAELADAFVVLPGGIGTLEEFFEVFTWAHLGLHQKPIAILNTNGFYDKLLDFLDFTLMQGFTKESVKKFLIKEEEIASLMQKIETYQVPTLKK